MKSGAFFRVIWALGGLALVLAWSRDAILALPPRPRELPREDGGTGKPWYIGDFVPGGAYPATAIGLLPAHIQNVGSWIDSDDRMGRAETAWFRTSRPTIHVAVAGYPQIENCNLWAEFRLSDDSITRVRCDLPDPGERWNVWSIPRPPHALAVRIIGEDRAIGRRGWLAFSHPFRAWQSFPAWYSLVQLFSTVALATTLLWGPGIIWRTRFTGAFSNVVLLGTGPLLLAGLGLLVWCASGKVSPSVLGGIIVTAIWIGIGKRLWSPAHPLTLPPGLGRAFGLSILVATAVAAKSAYSIGPEGEQFHGSISRNLAVGDRIDARFAYYVVQAAAWHRVPTSPEVDGLFFPWTFFSRGPLAGLATIPVVFATHGQPPTGWPDERWCPFDPYGFAAYRATMVVLASGIVVAIFLLLEPFTGPSWALIGAGLLALSPFGMHEVMFTWPKWAATTWAMASFTLVHTRRPFIGGLVLAVGYLFHPLVLLWAPWLGLWALGRSQRQWKALAVTGLCFGGGVALLVGPWVVTGMLAPHRWDAWLAGQMGFVDYFRRADRQLATWDTWWHTRWLNFANTFVPGHAYLSNETFHHYGANSSYGESGRLVKFALQWWTSLPFGLGLGLWLASVLSWRTAWRTFRWATVLFLICPALLMTAYWGWDPVGLMRECGHPLFVAIIAIACVIAAQQPGPTRRILGSRYFSWLQLPETWLMLWLTTLLNPERWPVEFDQLNSLYFGISIAAMLVAGVQLAHARANLAQDASAPSVGLAS